MDLPSCLSGCPANKTVKNDLDFDFGCCHRDSGERSQSKIGRGREEQLGGLFLSPLAIQALFIVRKF